MKEAHIWVYPVENTEYKDKGKGRTHFPSAQTKKRITEIKLTLDLFSGSDIEPVRLECQGVFCFFFLSSDIFMPIWVGNLKH